MSITREGYPLSFDVEAQISQIPLEAMIEAEPTEWSATPLGLLSDAHVIASQEKFYDVELPKRAELYEAGAPPAVVDLLHMAIQGVHQRRGLGNGLSYSQATEPQQAPDYFNDLRAAAYQGQANALGLFVLGHLLDVPSIELGKITFAGHLWPNLRGEAKAMFRFINPGAKWVADTLDKEPRFGLATPMMRSESDGRIIVPGDDEPLQAVTVRARKFRGELTPQAHVREVVNLLIRLDPESGFDQTVAKQLQESYKPYLAAEATLGRAACLADFRQSLRNSIASDSEPIPTWAIPLTSTVYVYDPTWPARHPRPSQREPDTQVWMEHLEQIRTDQQAVLARQERLQAGGWLNS